VYRIDGAVHDQLLLLNPWPLLVEKSVGLPLGDVACAQPWRLTKLAGGPFQILGIYFASCAGCTGEKPLNQKGQPATHYAIKTF
jgi:hypothetical protein